MNWYDWCNDRGLLNVLQEDRKHRTVRAVGAASDESAKSEQPKFGEFTQTDLKSLEWKPTDEDRAAAWTLFTEMRTRIVTRPLPYRTGDEAAALSSVYQMFGFTRDAIKTGGIKCRHFAMLSTAMLNDLVRPFTTKWHRRMEEGDLKVEFHCREFRAELQRLQMRLRRFETAFESMALDSQVAPVADSTLKEEFELLEREDAIKWPDSASSRKKRVLAAIQRDLPGDVISSVSMPVASEACRSNQSQPVGVEGHSSEGSRTHPRTAGCGEQTGFQRQPRRALIFGRRDSRGDVCARRDPTSRPTESPHGSRLSFDRLRRRLLRIVPQFVP
jgi:hypothetical protein